jgi:cytochrome c oxidase subunit II
LASSDLSPRPILLSESIITATERRWFCIMAAMLGVMVAVIVVTGMTNMLHPPSSVEKIDPTTLHLQGEFVESNLGTALEPDGSATVRIIAQQYTFVPECVTVPANTLIHFRLTSSDVTHGFFVDDTNTNAMVVPGFITDVRAKFQRPGTYTMPCDEFCGFGHHAMAARVVVVPKNQFTDGGPDERTTCGAQ